MKELQELLSKLLKDPAHAEPLSFMIRDMVRGYAEGGDNSVIDFDFWALPTEKKVEEAEKFIKKFMEKQRKIAGEIKEDRDIRNIPNN